jgi:hypothetical protein
VPTIQQFGISAFNFGPQDEKVELSIVLDQPFASANYVVVAMTNHEAYCAVLKEQTPEQAVVTILRTRFSPQPTGFVHWIAIGEQA